MRPNPELVIDEPPGFDGTSFASPLVAGLAALLPEPRDLGEMAGLTRAATPLLLLLLRYREDREHAPARTVTTLLAGFDRFAARVPASHHHWKPDAAAPSAVCPLVMMDWYDARVAVDLLRGGADDALRWGTVAATIAPFSATSASHAGLAWLHHAERSSGAVRDDALMRAQAQFDRVVHLAPGVEMFSVLRDRVVRAHGNSR